MKQTSLKLNLNVKKTRKQIFLEQMEQVVPWAELVALIAQHAPRRPPMPLAVFLGHHVASPFHAAVVHFEGSGHGRSFV